MNNKTWIALDALWKNLALAIIYAILAKVAENYIIIGGTIVAPIFPSTGVALAAVLWWGYRVLPGVWLGAFLDTALFNHNFLLASVVASGATLEAFFGAWLLLKLTHTRTPFYRPFDVTVFIFGSAFLACLINPSISVTTLYLLNLVTAEQFSTAWLNWWLGDATGTIAVGTCILVWYDAKLAITLKKAIELLVLVSLFFIFVWIEHYQHWPLARILLAITIWSAIRFGPQTTSLVCLATSFVVFDWSINWYYAYRHISFNQAILFSQIFIVITFFMSFMLIAVLAQRDKAKQYLIEANEELENRVLRRTQDLAEKNKALHTAISDLKQAQAQLIQAEKMSALGILTAGIAHEINNSVNFISANITPLKNNISDLTDLLKKYLGISSVNHLEQEAPKIEKFIKEINLDYTIHETQQLMAGIQDGAQRTTTIVKDLRTFSRLDESDLKYVNIHHNIDSTLTLLKSHYKDRIIITKNYGDIPEVECYPGKINQVLMNLLTNAIQAIPDKGEVIITTAKENNKHILISIKDSGTGMNKEVMEKIFEPFFTTKEVGKGTGLGLPISYSIIQEHHGKIIVNSELGKGSEFIIYLPITHMKTHE